jgi:hypothetical protein
MQCVLVSGSVTSCILLTPAGSTNLQPTAEECLSEGEQSEQAALSGPTIDDFGWQQDLFGSVKFTKSHILV